MTLWVKICGVRSAETARACVDAGANAIGVNFYEKSVRYVTLEQAAEVVDAVPEGFPVYGVFVDAARGEIERVLSVTGIGGVQFHGNESLAEVVDWDLPVIFARRVVDPLDESLCRVLTDPARYRGKLRLLLDGPGGGGGGRRFDARILARRGFSDLSECIVAGGLTQANVAASVVDLRPFGVDTAGGVETAPGMKDSGLIREFVDHARIA